MPLKLFPRLFFVGFFLAQLAAHGQTQSESFGSGQLFNQSIIEGSVKYGGSQPDFVVDLNAPEFAPLMQFAQSLRSQNLSPMAKAQQISAFISASVFPDRGQSVRYKELNADHFKAGTPIPLSALIKCGSGVCRENSFVFHLVLKNAGVENRVVYAHLKSPNIDHSFVVFKSDGREMIADSYYGNFHAREMTSVLVNGEMTKINLFPKYVGPKDALEDEQRPLIDFVDEQTLRQIVIESVSKIPDLQKVWKWAVENRTEVLVGGGVLRGLLLWIYKEVRSGGVEYLRRLPVPPIKDLLILSGADIDLYIHADQIAALKSAIPEVKAWDISPLIAHESSLKGGGGTLDKVLVSPSRIEDQWGALKAYHEGRLEYREVSFDEIKDTFWFKERGNSKIAMILRFLRIAQDLPNLMVPENVSRILRAAVAEDLPRLEERHRRWVEKGLDKLFQATGFRVEVVAKLLKDYGLLEALVKKGFRVRQASLYPVDFNELSLVGLNAEETADTKMLFSETRRDSMLDLRLLYGGNVPAAEIKKLLQKAKTMPDEIAIINSAVEMMQTPDDFIELMKPAKESHSTSHKRMLSDCLSNHFDRFLALKPTIADLRKLMQMSAHSYGADAKIALKAASLMPDPERLIELLTPTNPKNLESQKAMSSVLPQILKIFMDLKPTLRQLRKLMEQISVSPATDAEIVGAAGSIVKTPADFAELFRPSPGDKDSRTRMGQGLLHSLSQFLQLRPRFVDVQALMKSFSDSDILAQIATASVGTASTVQELMSLLAEPPDANPVAKAIYEKTLRSLQFFERFAELPLNERLQRTQSVREFFQILGVNEAGPFPEMAEKLAILNLQKLMSLGPSAAELTRLGQKSDQLHQFVMMASRRGPPESDATIRLTPLESAKVGDNVEFKGLNLRVAEVTVVPPKPVGWLGWALGEKPQGFTKIVLADRNNQGVSLILHPQGNITDVSPMASLKGFNRFPSREAQARLQDDAKSLVAAVRARTVVSLMDHKNRQSVQTSLMLLESELKSINPDLRVIDLTLKALAFMATSADVPFLEKLQPLLARNVKGVAISFHCQPQWEATLARMRTQHYAWPSVAGLGLMCHEIF